MKIKLLGGTMEKLSRKGTLSPEAHSLYLEGLYHKGYSRGVLERSFDDFSKAIECFEKAIQLDPNYAQAYAGLADCYNNLGTLQFLKPAEALPKSRELSEKAIRLDDTVAEAHVSLAGVLYPFYWDFHEAENEFKKALVLNPNLVTARTGYADLLLVLGRYDESLAELKNAIERDPLNLDAQTDLGRLYALSGRYDDALVVCNRILDLDPTHISTYEWRIFAYAGKRMYSEALDSAEKFMPLFKGQMARTAMARINSIMGHQDEVRKIRDEILELSKKEYVTPVVLAVMYKLAGDSEEAYRMLDLAYEMRATELTYVRSHKLYFEEFYSDPRFIELEGKIGLLSEKEVQSEFARIRSP